MPKSVFFLIISAVSVTVAVNTKYLDPFNTPKLIIAILSASWLLGHILSAYKNSSSTTNFEYFKVTIFVKIFMVAMGVSFLFSEVFVTALIGETQRRNGFLGYLSLSIILLFSARNITYDYAGRIIKVSIILGIILSVYGLFQAAGIDFVAWENPYSDVIVTLGNPNFASAILALLTLIALISILNPGINLTYKILAGLTSCLSLIAIVYSQSRQGLVVLMFGILFYSGLVAYLKKSKLRYLTYGVSGTLFIASIFGMLQKGPLTSLLYKDSVSVRGYYWRAGIQMFLDKPLTGVGLDSYGSFFKAYRESNYPLKYGFNLTSSNAHNTFIQLFSTAGLIVGMSYLALVVYIFITGVKLAKRANGENQRILTTILVAWVGFQAQSLISIDNLGISVWGWLFGGCILGIRFTEANNSINSKDAKSNTNKNFRGKAQPIIPLLQPALSALVLIPSLVLAMQLNNMEKHSAIVRGLVLSNSTANRNLVESYSNSVISNPVADPNYKFAAARALINIGLVEKSHLEIINLHRHDPRNLDFLLWLAEYEQSKLNSINELNFRIKIAQLDPWNAPNLSRAAFLYSNLGQKSKSKQYYVKILDFLSTGEIADDARKNIARLEN